MGKTRLSKLNAIYVIPDVHGMHNQLRLILNRILPLRKSDGGQDILVMLGDYLDRHEDSHKVLDTLISVKNQFPTQTFFLKGNHEEMFMSAIYPDSILENYKNWIDYGGYQTLTGYLKRNNIDITDPYLFQRNRIIQLIPKEHIDFISNLLSFYEDEHNIFVHAACDPHLELGKQSLTTLLWDRNMFKAIRKMVFTYGRDCLCWKKRIITGHNGNINGFPFITDKFWMIDGSPAKKVYLFDVNSTADIYYSADQGKTRLVKHNYNRI